VSRTCYDSLVTTRTALLLSLPLLFAACESHEVSRSSTYGSPTGLSPAPTRVESTRGERIQEKRRKKDEGFFEGLFKDDKDKSSSKAPKRSGISIASPAGTHVNLSRNYTGQTTFQEKDGRKYRLRYEGGTLVGIESEVAEPTVPASAQRSEEPAADEPATNEE
jgi:hypothetical protein